MEGSVELQSHPLSSHPARLPSEASNSDHDETSSLTSVSTAVDTRLHGVRTYDDAEQERKISLLEAVRSIAHVAMPFFKHGGIRCWATAIMVIASLAVETWITVQVSVMTKIFHDALKDKDETTFWLCIARCSGYAVLLMIAVFLYTGASGAFALEWRRFITNNLLSDYIDDREAYYRLKMQRADIDNPDQRIGEDIGKFCGIVVPLFCQLMKAFMTIVSMSAVLYMVAVKLFWFMIFGSLFLCLVTLGVFGAPLMRMQRTILAREAYLRHALVRIREYSESIAFYRGATFERERCKDSFTKVIQAWYRKLMVATPYHSFIMSMQVGMHFVPAMLMASEYFKGNVDFGSISQATMLFGQLANAMTTLATEMDNISNLGAQAVRVKQLQEGLGEDICSDGSFDEQDEVLVKQHASDNIHLQEMQPAGAVHKRASPPAEGAVCLRLSSVTLMAPQGLAPLVTGLSLVLRERESMMISGPSGTGKSSLLRAISGLWGSGHGSIERSNIKDCFFAPQAPYLCMGTLRQNATYPHSAEFPPCLENDALVRRALDKLSIGYLMERHGLDVDVNWDDTLSGGEKQRLGFTRLLLRRNIRLALLDEATSAMDVENEDRAHELLQGCVPCFVSVAHHQNVEKYHTHKLTLRPVEVGGCEGDFKEI